jgi:hypothetical protein
MTDFAQLLQKARETRFEIGKYLKEVLGKGYIE